MTAPETVTVALPHGLTAVYTLRRKPTPPPADFPDVMPTREQVEQLALGQGDMPCPF